MAAIVLNELMDKRAAARIAKYNAEIMAKPIKDLTVEDLNKIGLEIMAVYYKGAKVPAVYIPAETLRIIFSWAQDKKVSIIE
jgi:hypothetical protein